MTPPKRSIAQTILLRMRRHGAGRRVYTPHDFKDLGTGQVVANALRALDKDGKIRRLGQGVYDYPRFNELLGRHAPPNVDLIAQALARRAGVAILPDGIQAANGLGLTNAVPAHPTYITNGKTKSYTIGGTRLQFRHRSPKYIRWADIPGGVVIQALSWLGKDTLQANPDIIADLRSRLADDVRDSLSEHASLAPARWMIPYLRALALEPKENDGKRLRATS